MTLDVQPEQPVVAIGPATKQRRASVVAGASAADTVHVCAPSARKTTTRRIRFGVVGPTPWIALGAISGAVGLGMAWLPLAPLFVAGVAFGYARYVYTQAIRCTVCLAVFRSPAAFNAHTCDPIPSRRRKRVT